MTLLCFNVTLIRDCLRKRGILWGYVDSVINQQDF